MIIRRNKDRGQVSLGWLKSQHTFSFGHYYDPKYMGFGPLRVINEDHVQPGKGFATHGHQDMEIISYVLEGALEHQDSMGNGSVIRPGDVQRMTAGTGVEHSEFNHSETQFAHFLQIWILPERNGLTPGYEQRNFPADDKRGRLKLVASADGREQSVKVHQDVSLYASLLTTDQSLQHILAAGRKAWVQIAAGSISLQGELLQAGDGAALEGEQTIDITANTNTELLLFDMA